MIALDPQLVVSVLAGTLLATGGVLAALPVGTCPECGHCRLEKLARERQRDEGAARAYRIPFCATCGKHHHSDEGHSF